MSYVGESNSYVEDNNTYVGLANTYVEDNNSSLVLNNTLLGDNNSYVGVTINVHKWHTLFYYILGTTFKGTLKVK